MNTQTLLALKNETYYWINILMHVKHSNIKHISILNTIIHIACTDYNRVGRTVVPYTFKSKNKRSRSHGSTSLMGIL